MSTFPLGLHVLKWHAKAYRSTLSTHSFLGRRIPLKLPVATPSMIPASITAINHLIYSMSALPTEKHNETFSFFKFTLEFEWNVSKHVGSCLTNVILMQDC